MGDDDVVEGSVALSEAREADLEDHGVLKAGTGGDLVDRGGGEVLIM